MNKIKTIFLIVTLFAITLSCTSIKEGLSSSKNNTDEFLVEKKAPLVIPPDYNELPIPSNNSIEENQEEDVKKLITKSENNNSDMQNSNNSENNLEKSILEKIKN
jgi:hypothetical protein